MTKLGFIGDSNFDQYVTTAEKCGTLIGAALGYPVVIDGVSGSGATSVLSRLPALMAQGTTHVIVMIGTNEMAGSLGITLATMLGPYLTTMGQIIDAIVAAGNVPIIWSPPACEQPQECLRYPTMIKGLKDLCTAKGCLFFDVHGVMSLDACARTSSADWLLWYLPPAADLYHLSATGHQRLATAFLAADMIVPAPPPPPPPPPGDPVVVFDHALTSSFGNITTRTIKVDIAIPAHASLRITLQAHADETLILAKLYVGATSMGAVTIPAGQQLVLPWVAHTGALTVSFYCNGGASNDKLATATGFGTTWLKDGDYASQVGTAGFTAFAGYSSLITKIEAL